MKIRHILSTALTCMPLICTAQESAQQDIIPYISRLVVYSNSAAIELTVGSASGNKLFLCGVEDLCIRDAKGNMLNSYAGTFSASFITELLPNKSIYTNLNISERIRSARITVSGTLVLESVPAQSLATAYIPLQLNTPALHRIGEQELYIRGEKRHIKQGDTPLYSTISISSESDTPSPSRIQQFRWWQKGTCAADVAEEFGCNLIAAAGGAQTQEETYAANIPVNTCTLEVRYWPKGETVRIPFRFNVSLNRAEPVQP